MVQMEMTEQHLTVKVKPPLEVIVDKERDIRICDGRHVIKVRLFADGKLRDMLVDDIFVWGEK